MKKVRIYEGEKNLRLRGGKEVFTNPQLAHIIQEIDTQAKKAYDEIGDCFFEASAEGGFKEKEDQNARYQLLPYEQRIQKVTEYTRNRPWLSEGVKLGLLALAKWAKDEQAITTRELERATRKKGDVLTSEESSIVEKRAADRFWAYKDLSYTMVFSAKKSSLDDAPEWFFGFEPRVFSVEGLVEASAFTDKLITRDISRYYTPEQLKAVQAREKNILANVMNDHSDYKKGPGFSVLEQATM